MNTFDNMAGAKRHFSTVHNSRMFTCEICGAQSNRKDNFKTHLTKKHNLSDVMAKAIIEKM